MEKDEEGRNKLTHEYVVSVCEFNGQYTTPACNSQLYLHYKGFSTIEGLDRYTKVKSIWLECNGINKIQGLDHMVGLRCLYLHQNKIKRMENLTFFPKSCDFCCSNLRALKIQLKFFISKIKTCKMGKVLEKLIKLYHPQRTEGQLNLNFQAHAYGVAFLNP